METDSPTRRLAAILAMDVVGYSRLVGIDERDTLDRVRSDRIDLIEPELQARSGRVVKLMGDGILAEFPSAVEAVECAATIQDKISLRNTDIEADRQIVYRIGINVGDIVVDEGDILGDGVNIAARLEALSDPGGICISHSVHAAVGNRVGLQFVDIGAQDVKNISEPVHAYKVLCSGETPEHVEPNLQATHHAGKPSIAVLPFTNMSNDPEQEYFADGIVEDIITALSHVRQWFVVARNSSFVYKGQNVDIRKVARELGVRYVLEGSVRKAGNQLRITGQLIEAETGTHLWADKYDGDLSDVFTLQDEITESVVGAIEPSLRKAEIDRSKRKRPGNIGAYDLYLRSLPHLFALRPDDNRAALDLLNRAIELEPDYALALAYLAWGHHERYTRGWGESDEDNQGTAIDLARQALVLDREDALVLAICAFVLVMGARDYDQGLQAARRALEINPNIAFVSFLSGVCLCMSGERDTGLPHIEDAIRISPGDPGAFLFYTSAAFAHLMSDRPDKALELCTKSMGIYPGWDTTYRVMASAQVRLGKMDEARATVAALRELAPNLTIQHLRERWPIRDQALLESVLSDLKAAGMLE